MSDYLSLSYTQVAMATLLMLINGGVSIVFRLGLERTLLLACVRTIGQLLLIGMILSWIFAQQTWTFVIAVVCLMTMIAGITASSRMKRRYRNLFFNTVFSMAASSWLVGAYAFAVVLHGIQPWYQPQYVIPVMGMILGNTLNGISIGLDSILESLATEQRSIEVRLSLGANRWEACQPELRKAIHAGMIPIINSMMIVGLVSLPGMMTGQLLTGAHPGDAVKYQIVIMFLIASATAMGTVISVVLACRKLITNAHRLELDQIQ